MLKSVVATAISQIGDNMTDRSSGDVLDRLQKQVTLPVACMLANNWLKQGGNSRDASYKIFDKLYTRRPDVAAIFTQAAPIDNRGQLDTKAEVLKHGKHLDELINRLMLGIKNRQGISSRRSGQAVNVRGIASEHACSLNTRSITRDMWEDLGTIMAEVYANHPCNRANRIHQRAWTILTAVITDEFLKGFDHGRTVCRKLTSIHADAEHYGSRYHEERRTSNQLSLVVNCVRKFRTGTTGLPRQDTVQSAPSLDWELSVEEADADSVSHRSFDDAASDTISLGGYGQQQAIEQSPPARSQPPPTNRHRYRNHICTQVSISQPSDGEDEPDEEQRPGCSRSARPNVSLPLVPHQYGAPPRSPRSPRRCLPTPPTQTQRAALPQPPPPPPPHSKPPLAAQASLSPRLLPRTPSPAAANVGYEAAHRKESNWSLESIGSAGSMTTTTRFEPTQSNPISPTHPHRRRIGSYRAPAVLPGRSTLSVDVAPNYLSLSSHSICPTSPLSPGWHAQRSASFHRSDSCDQPEF